MSTLLDWLDRVLDTPWAARGTQTLLIDFANAFDERRAQLGMSMDDAAKAAGLNPNCVKLMLRDPGGAKVEHLVRLANAVGMTLAFRLEERE